MPQFKITIQCPVLIISASTVRKARKLYEAKLAEWEDNGYDFMELVVLEEGVDLGPPDLIEEGL